MQIWISGSDLIYDFMFLEQKYYKNSLQIQCAVIQVLSHHCSIVSTPSQRWVSYLNFKYLCISWFCFSLSSFILGLKIPPCHHQREQNRCLSWNIVMKVGFVTFILTRFLLIYFVAYTGLSFNC